MDSLAEWFKLKGGNMSLCPTSTSFETAAGVRWVDCQLEPNHNEDHKNTRHVTTTSTVNGHRTPLTIDLDYTEIINWPRKEENK